jgi:hypothetical protein
MTKLRTLVLGAAAVGLLAYRQSGRPGPAPAAPALLPAPSSAESEPIAATEAIPAAPRDPVPVSQPVERGVVAARLLLLLAVAALALLGVALDAGVLTRREEAAAAGAAGGVLLLALASLARVPRRPRPARTAAPSPRGRSLTTTKRVLVLALLAGIAVYVGGGGVFGSFSAETTNGGNTTSSGTLTMSDQVNTNTACLSVNGTSNVNAGCGAMLTMTNVAPGVFGTQNVATMTIKNTGSIDASKLWAWAPPNHTTLTSQISGSVSTLPVAALPTAVVAGQSIVVKSSPNSQTFVASAPALQGATSISVTTQTANATYPIGSTADVVDCYDQKTTTPGVVGATKGTDLNFNATAGNPLCQKLLFYVQETTGTVAGTPGTHNYCWAGLNYGDSSGMCVAPISVTLSSTLSGAQTSLPVSALNGNVRSGDSIVLTNGTTQQTVTASANAYIGATSISINSATVNFASGTTIIDQTTLNSLNSDTTDTIYNFDTLHNGTIGPVELSPVTANGTLQASGPTVELAATASRQFQVGVYMPLPSGINQNPLQGLFSTFGLTWHIDQ